MTDPGSEGTNYASLRLKLKLPLNLSKPLFTLDTIDFFCGPHFLNDGNIINNTLLKSFFKFFNYRPETDHCQNLCAMII